MGWATAGSFTRPGAALVMPLVAAFLLMVEAGPAAAVDGQADHPAAYQACPEGDIPAAGFEDTVDHFAAAAIDCMAHYRITFGTSATRFSPNAPITRAQLASFLVRAAGPAGITLAAPTNQGFEDIDGERSSVQDAINRLAALGITRGTSATTFSPGSAVTRSQMALFLYRFLAAGRVGPGGVDTSDVVPDDTAFTDLAGIPSAAVDAIRALYEMGVTAGATSTTFAPGHLVTRAQMALFISRALSHTNARPAGITIQSESTDVSAGDTFDAYISVRNEDHSPAAGKLVDIFSTPTTDPFSSFDSAGRCIRDRGAESAFGGKVCTIDVSDRRLDDRGNLLVSLQPVEDKLLWAWSGVAGDEFSSGSSDYGNFELEVLKPAAALRVRDDMPTTATALKMGDTVTMVLQLVDDENKPVREEGVKARITTTFTENGVLGRTIIKTYRTDGTGRITLPLRAVDPGTQSGNDTVTLDIDVSVESLGVLDHTTPGVVGKDADESADAVFTWSEEPASPSKLRLRQLELYHELRRSGPGPVHRVWAILTDQYGDRVPGVAVAFSSDDATGVGTGPIEKITDEQGKAEIRYLRDSSVAAAEVISARTVGVIAAPITHYWATEAKDGKSALGIEIVLGDAGGDVVLYDVTSPKLLRYDTNDSFAISGAAVSHAAFEEALALGDYTRISFTNYSRDPEGVASFELSNTRIFDNP